MGISVFGLRTSAGLWRGTRSGEIVRRAAIIQKEYDVQKVHFFKNAPTAMEIQTLLARCPRLEVLDLSGCPLSPKEMNEISRAVADLAPSIWLPKLLFCSSPSLKERDLAPIRGNRNIGNIYECVCPKTSPAYFDLGVQPPECCKEKA